MTPTRVHLGADAWALLVEALPGAPLPWPFRSQDRVALDAPARAAAERALRDADLLVGAGGDLEADLRPWLGVALRALAGPTVVVDSSVGLGDMLRIAHHAIRGDDAAGLVCSQRPAGSEELELGPIELSAPSAPEVVGEVLRGFGSLEGDPQREPIRLAGATSAAPARALDDDRADMTRAVIEHHAMAPALGGGLRAVARVEVLSAAGRRRVTAARVSSGWWIAGRCGDDVVLRPVAKAALVAELHAALAG